MRDVKRTGRSPVWRIFAPRRYCSNFGYCSENKAFARVGFL